MDFAAGLAGRNCLVTGASGFIGRRLVAALADLGAVVTVLGRSRHSFAHFGDLPLRKIQGDMTDAGAMAKALAGQEVVFNLAYDFRASGQANLAGLEALMTAAQKAATARIVHVSSIVVYDDWPGGDVNEASSMRSPGGGAYRQTKIAMEKRLMAGTLPAAILQPTIVYGPGSAQWTDGFAEALLNGSVLLPTPEGLCQGVFVDDVVQGLLRAATLPDLVRERFILSGPAPFKWSELIAGYRDILGQGTLQFCPADALRPSAAQSDAAAQDTEMPPSAAARISALGRRLLGHQRFEALVRKAKKRLRPGGEMRPDAHLFELLTTSGHCPIDAARQRLGYAPAYDLAKGLAATASHLRNMAS
jgi:nucleoside-diphosphate-sugar epimerase